MDGEATGVPEQPSETIEILDVDDADAVVAAAAEDPEIEKAVSSIAPSDDGPPVGTEIALSKPLSYSHEKAASDDEATSSDWVGKEFIRSDNYSSNASFEAVGGAPATQDKESQEKTLEEIRKQHGIKFKPPANMSDSIVTSLRCLLIDGIAIADEEALKSALLLILPAMNGRKFTLDDQLRNQRPNVLYSMFRRELRSRGKKELADKLETGSGRTSPPPLPPPSGNKK